MRLGTGQWRSPIVQPSGNVQRRVGAAPEAPGLRQYRCQCGIRSKRNPSYRVCPGATGDGSLSKVTVACGVATDTAPWAGGAASGPSSRRKRVSYRPGLMVCILVLIRS